MTTRTLFQAGSISKPVAAVMALRMVEAGKLDLDEDVNHYLTSWKVPANDGWQPKVTLRQLLSHTAGMTVHGFPGYAKGELVPSVVQVLNGDSLLLRMPGQEPAQIHPESTTAFFAKALEAEITFKRNEDGAVDSLTLRQSGKDSQAKKR